MNYIKITFSLLLTFLGGWISKNNIEIAFSSHDLVIERSGIINILSGYACFFIGYYLAIYWIKIQYNISFNIGEINKVIFIIFLFSLVFSVITFSIINKNIEGYVECKELRTISSRYSSRTYAISPEICSLLKNKNL